MNVQPLKKLYRVAATGTLTINGDLRFIYNEARISSEKDKLDGFTLGSRRFTESPPPPVDHLASLIGVFGAPAEAMKITDIYKKEAVLLRFKLNSASDLIVQLSKKGPLHVSMDKPKTLHEAAIRRGGKTTTPLPITARDLDDACKQLAP